MKEANSKIVELHKPCPKCNSSDAYCLYEDGHGYCYSCEYYLGPEKRNETEVSYQFLTWRGVESNTFRFYGCHTKVDKDGKPLSIGFRYPNGDHKVRILDKKEFYWVGDNSDKAGLFGQNKFSAGSHKYVTITEGELDALSIYQTLKSPVVSVQSSSSAVRDCTVARSWLNSFERIYLAFDSDASGREATSRVAKLFDYDKVFVVKFSARKDANEYIQHGEQDELRNIWWNSKKYLPETIISSITEFQEVLKGKPDWGVPYPFPTLTRRTRGIRTGESILITAQEGVGKTELMHAIEYQLLRETDDNVGAIFLEEPQRRHLQALAGLHLKRPIHLPDCNCTDDQVSDAIRELVQKDDRLHVYCHFGSDDPEVLLDNIRFLVTARQCKYILLDHITMAVSGLQSEDERRKLDYFSTRVEMMVKELDFALIVVSHVNDLGQTRGSRYIAKIADIRIDCTRDALHPDDTVRNTVVVTITKNRFSGETGWAGNLIFDHTTWCFTEDAGNDNKPENVPTNKGTVDAVPGGHLHSLAA